MSPTHDQLVEVAARWLRRTRGCSVVLTEMTTGLPETPDAIGWRCGMWSVLVECKTSRSDYARDKDKPSRRREAFAGLEDGWLAGLGQERYYLAPRGLLRAEEMPEGCGLCEGYQRTRHQRPPEVPLDRPHLSRAPDPLRRRQPRLRVRSRPRHRSGALIRLRVRCPVRI